jgi:prepilin-type processing-associated H-X9-DG protein
VYADYRHPKQSFAVAYCDNHVESKILSTKEEWEVSK